MGRWVPATFSPRPAASSLSPPSPSFSECPIGVCRDMSLPRPATSSPASLSPLSEQLLPLDVLLLSLGSLFFSGSDSVIGEKSSLSPLSSVSEQLVSIVVSLLSIVCSPFPWSGWLPAGLLSSFPLPLFSRHSVSIVMMLLSFGSLPLPESDCLASENHLFCFFCRHCYLFEHQQTCRFC